MIFKRMAVTILIAAVGLMVLSCDNSFELEGEYVEKYIFNCVLRVDTTFNVAYLSKNYKTEGENPNSYKNDPTIRGAVIRIWNDENFGLFKDTTLDNPPQNNNTNSYSLYYLKNFQFTPGKPLEVEVILKTGKKLKATAMVPGHISFNTEYSESMVSNQSPNDSLMIYWHLNQRDPAFLPRMKLYYKIRHYTYAETKSVEVPLYYIESGGKTYSIFPGASRSARYPLRMATLEKALQLISAGDPNKSRYEILECRLEVISFDAELNKYYQATARGKDTYSVKLNETDYSNINGGYGVFGAYIKSSWVIKFTEDYVKKFGYKLGVIH